MSLKGKLTNGLFCSAEVQQKSGCLSWVLKGGKNLEPQMVGEERAFQAVGWAKKQRLRDGSAREVLDERRVTGTAGARLEMRAGSGEVIEGHTGSKAVAVEPAVTHCPLTAAGTRLKAAAWEE